jgi:proline iminopeptidase
MGRRRSAARILTRENVGIATELFLREVGEGPTLVVLHGGPDFDHEYLLPELDRLATSFHLIYYAQRGRGRSAEGVEPEDVSLESEIEDLDQVRRSFGLETVAVLGHSWGGVLAMEYATRHPDRVSQLILVNTAPASHTDALALRAHLRSLRTPSEREAMEALSASSRYQAGDLAADAEYHRIHFRPAFSRSDLLEPLVGRLRANFTPERVVLARAIELRLYADTWAREEYDLRPRLSRLDVPTLVLHGADDFIPVSLAANVADAIPGAVLSVLPQCGHFSYIERPDDVHREIAALF